MPLISREELLDKIEALEKQLAERDSIIELQNDQINDLQEEIERLENDNTMFDELTNPNPDKILDLFDEGGEGW